MTLRVLAAALRAALLVLALAARLLLHLTGTGRPALTRRAGTVLAAAVAAALLIAWPRPAPASRALLDGADVIGQASGPARVIHPGEVLAWHPHPVTTLVTPRPRRLAPARPIPSPRPSPVPAPAPTPSPQPAPAPAGGPQAYAASILGSYGWGQDQMACLVPLWDRESGWRWDATNPGSGAYGIPQALPGSKMATAGADWQTNPDTQIRWGLGYIAGLYGTPCGAWAHEQADGWY